MILTVLLYLSIYSLSFFILVRWGGMYQTRKEISYSSQHSHIECAEITVLIPFRNEASRLDGLIESINKLSRISRAKVQELGREPTADELSEDLGMPLYKVRKVLKIAKEPISLDTPIGDDEDSSLGDFIEDTVIESPLDNATEDSLHFATDDVLASLTAREAKVLRMRFGIGMNTDHTLEEVGKQFDVTRERIRQIEAKALRKLRHPSRSSHLKSFLDD